MICGAVLYSVPVQNSHNHNVPFISIQIVGYTCLLVQFLGPSVFAGIAAMLVIMPLNAYFLIK